jgi:hypothetical protein
VEVLCQLETRIGLLDRLTEFFGPNGAMMGQVSGRLGSFTEDLNCHLRPFGYTCNLSIEPFEIRVISSTHAHTGPAIEPPLRVRTVSIWRGTPSCSGNGNGPAICRDRSG